MPAPAAIVAMVSSPKRKKVPHSILKRPAKIAGVLRRTAPLPGPVVNSKFVPMASIIQVENVRKVYHVGKMEVLAVNDVSFQVERGEFVAVVGPSGSGKSTLFYMLGGLTHSD